MAADAPANPELASVHDAFVQDRRAGTKLVLQRGIDRGELRPDLDLELACDLLTGPVFLRHLMSHMPVDLPYLEQLRTEFLRLVPDCLTGRSGEGRLSSITVVLEGARQVGRSEEAPGAVRAVGPARAPGVFTVEETARRVGNYKWIEMRLFEVLGGWVATVPELDVKLRLGTPLLPPRLARRAVAQAPARAAGDEPRPPHGARRTTSWSPSSTPLTEPEAPELTIEKLVGVYRVLIPHKIAAYTYHLNNTSTITDAPTHPVAQVHPRRTSSRTGATARC